MKTKLLLLFIYISTMSFGQSKSDSISILRFTPISQKISKVNGLAIGLGLDEAYESLGNQNIKKHKIINGLNLEINLLAIVWICFYKPDRFPGNETSVVNGANISFGGFLKNTSHNGINFSVYNYGRKMNGISFTFFGTYVESLNGFYFSCFGNSAKVGRGISISGLNEINDFKGFQVGLVNDSDKLEGVQFGLINKSKTGKNIQIGLWNKNEKRQLPIINWNFKTQKL